MKPTVLERKDIFATIEDYVIILRHRWRLVLCTVAPLFSVLAVVIFLLPRVYQATTTIMVDPQQVPDRYVSTTVVDDPSERLNLITQEVLSTSRLDSVIEKLNLYPRLRKQKGHDATIDLMRSNIQIQTKHTGGNGPSSFTITFEANAAPVAAMVANELADTFIQSHLQSRQQRVEGTTAFLSDELAQTRRNLEIQEKQISEYRMQHLGEMPDQMQANLQALAQFQAQLQAVTEQLSHLDEERIILERVPDSIVSATPGLSSPRVTLQSQINLAESQLREMESRYTPQHPDIVSLQAHLADMRKQLAAIPSPSSAANSTDNGTMVRLEVMNRERARLLDQQRVLTGRISNYQAKVDAVPLRQEELSNLTRDYESSKEHYRSLLEKNYSAEMATQLEAKQQGERFQVIDKAQPPDKPLSPNRPRFLAGAFLLALAVGIGLAIIRERTDPRLKSRADLLRLFDGVELLGTVPRIESLAIRSGSFA